MDDCDLAVLYAICDTMVIKALERVGGYLVRTTRSRHKDAAGVPRYEIHTIWRDNDLRTARAIGQSWDPLPALIARNITADVDTALVRTVLDGYVHDLVVTGTPHRVSEMIARLRDRAGVGGPPAPVDVRTGARVGH